jgi:uncharacterized membrane protein (Fun14 family)
MSQIAGSPLVALGAGGALGYCVGYAAKKVLKLVAIIVGLVAGTVMAVAYYLEQQGIITFTVNYDRLNMVLQYYFGLVMGNVSGLTAFAQNFGVGIAGFVGGLYLGFQRG